MTFPISGKSVKGDFKVNQKFSREKEIVKTSVIGIITNILLVGFKAFIGFLAFSVSIIMDAVNNMTDALSSLITIIGTKLAGKKPTKKHPYGYGRIEYLTSTLIAFIILFAGGTAIYESVISLVEHQTPSYDKWSIIIISVAVIVKIALGLYFRKKGKEVSSDALKSSGVDALFDSILSLSTLVAIVISLTTGFNIEGYLGIIIGLFILKSGFSALKDSLSQIVGDRLEKEKADNIKRTILAHDQVRGVYDLIVNNYGPNKSIGSVHIEIADDLTAKEIQYLERQLQIELFSQFSIIMTIGIYASNDSTPLSRTIKSYLTDLLKKYPHIVQMHGFYVDEIKRTVLFDIIFDFDETAQSDIIKEIHDTLKSEFKEFEFNIVVDTDFAD